MPQIKRNYKIIAEHPRIIKDIERCLMTWGLTHSENFPMFSSDADKERIKSEREELHQENILNLKQDILSVYPEFSDPRWRLSDYGRQNSVPHFTIVRTIEIMTE